MQLVCSPTSLRCLSWVLTVHAGAIVLIFLILSMLILACRRRRHSKATSKVMVSNFGGQPQPFPSWRDAQQPIQTPYGPDATNMGWYYPAQGTAPPDQAKSTTPSGQVQKTEQVPGPAPFGEVQRPPHPDQMQRPAPAANQTLRTPPLDQVQRPAPTNQVVRTPTSGQVQKPAPSGQVQRPPPTSQVQTTVPSGQAQTPSPPGPVQSIAPTGRPHSASAAPLVRAQEQGIPVPPPPRRAHTKGTLSSVAPNDVESPPPYYPVSRLFSPVLHDWSHVINNPHFFKPTGPSTPPPTQAAR